MIDDEGIAKILKLREDLFSRPSVGLIDEAAAIYAAYPRVELPDFVEALAKGNKANWPAVIHVAREDLAPASEGGKR